MVRKPNSRDFFFFGHYKDSLSRVGWQTRKKKFSPWHIRESWQNTWWIMASKKGHAAVGNSFNKYSFFREAIYRQKIVRGFQDYNDCSCKRSCFFFFWGGGTEVAGAFHKKKPMLVSNIWKYVHPFGEDSPFDYCFSDGLEPPTNEMGMVLWTHLREFVRATDLFFEVFRMGFLSDPISWNEPQKEPFDFPLLYTNWFFHRDPYDGLLGLL